MYQITNIKQDFRFRTDSIILCHVRDTWKFGSYIEPTAKEGSYHYTWGLWQQYYYQEVKRKKLPCHYFSEFLDKDWVIYQGCNLTQQSWFLRDLAESGVIPYQYKDSLLIVIGEDFSSVPFEDRLSDHLCDKLISGLMRLYHIDINKILLLDNILINDWENTLKLSELNYDITLQRYFDIKSLKMNLGRFLKK